MTAAAASMDPGEFMKAAPAALNGNTAYAQRYAGELRRVFHEHAARAPRTLQLHLGPSELGVACDRQVAGKMAGLPTTNHVADPWPSIRGTALHAWAAEAFTADNARTGVLRWLVEQRVSLHAFPAVAENPGTFDLYDAAEWNVDDHKFLGDTSMAKVRSAAGPPRKYVVQLLLYGLGCLLLGLPVRRVIVAAYPATAASLDGLFVWERGFTSDGRQLLDDVVALLTEVFADTQRRKDQALDLHAGRTTFTQIPMNPDSDECYFCPFYRPQSARDGGAGCPGTARPK